MALQFYESAVAGGVGNGVGAGLFIPVANIPMVSAGEFADAEPQGAKEGKALLGMGTAIYDYFTANSGQILGMSASRTQASVSEGIINWTYSYTYQKVARSDDGSFDVLPLPTIGDNAGLGGLNIEDIFANAVVVANEGAISGEGVLIPNSMILGGASAGLGADKRDYFQGLFASLTASGGVTVRASGVVSGITAINNPNNMTIFTLAPSATDATNPTTGILAEDLNKIATVQKTVSYTLQLLLNDSTGNFDINAIAS